MALRKRRDGEVECRDEGVAELCDDPVDEGPKDGIMELPEKVHGLLASCGVDVGEADLADDGALDIVSSGLSVLEDDSLGRHADDGQKEWTEWGLVSSVGPAGARNGG